MSLDVMPLISVIVPVYNHSSYVEECLDSLLNADYEPLEVLVLDDGSRDSSYEVIKAWRARHPEAFFHFELMRQRNQGAARTCNTLLGLAQGSYIAPLASDDCLLPGGLTARLRYLEQNPQILAVMGDCTIISDSSDTICESALFDYRKSDRRAFTRPEFLADELVLRWTVPGPVLLLRREAFCASTGVGLFAEDGGVEDRDFYLRLLQRNALAFVPEKVAAYRVHIDNSCRPTTLATRVAHYKARLISERKYIGLFKGRRRLFLQLASIRFACLVRRLERGSQIARLGEIVAGAGMLTLYYSTWIRRRLVLARGRSKSVPLTKESEYAG